MERQGLIRKRIGRFVLLMGMMSVITLVVVVTQRLSNDSLALLIGLFVGIAAMLPTIGLGVFLLRREMIKPHTTQTHTSTPAAMPPVVVVTPQALRGYGMPPSSAIPSGPYAHPSPWLVSNSQRRFTIVGEGATE